jgi:uncharacterized damage-inducible protein DinB
MAKKTTKKRLIELIRILRAYGNRILDGLTEEQIKWTPEGTKGRSISSYLRHILNSETFWFNMMGDDSFKYFGNKVPFNELFNSFQKYGEMVLNLIEKTEFDDLIIQNPVFEDGNYQKLIQKGTIAWAIWRTSMHAVHHFGQCAYIRYALENPPSEKLPGVEGKSDPWGYVMDKIVFLAHSDDED